MEPIEKWFLITCPIGRADAQCATAVDEVKRIALTALLSILLKRYVLFSEPINVVILLPVMKMNSNNISKDKDR